MSCLHRRTKPSFHTGAERSLVSGTKTIQTIQTLSLYVNDRISLSVYASVEREIS